jgi:hypothetical protein
MIWRIKFAIRIVGLDWIVTSDISGDAFGSIYLLLCMGEIIETMI